MLHKPILVIHDSGEPILFLRLVFGLFTPMENLIFRMDLFEVVENIGKNVKTSSKNQVSF